MSRVIFPMSQEAVPKTNAEREATERATKRAEELNGPPDEPFYEMSRDARVWRTYVRETDNWDKEMVDGRNNSLDVLLIFAALFSAISTTFIVDSLGDLKPDPAESSAQTLLAMSQTLFAIANGQPVSQPDQESISPSAFSPPRSAVIVNVLWLLSLSLSVAVSLMAMLAKEWCYKFMSGRSGQIYDQARRRQQKWNGIEKWRMQEVLTHLPGLMHLALLLFAIGLCIYLWDIDISVAVPATVVTAIGVLVYVSATILPAFDEFCPYNTPATLLMGAFWVWFCSFYKPIHLLLERCMDRTRSTYIQIIGWILFILMLPYVIVVKYLGPESIDQDHTYVDGQDNLAPMDDVTSRMLAWMIINCEDSRSVDVALQAIAGARPQLPCVHLVRCGGLKLVYERLDAFMKQKQESNEYQLRDSAVLQVMLRYSRSFGVLLSGDMIGLLDGSWRLREYASSDFYRYWTIARLCSNVQSMQMSLITCAKQQEADRAIVAAAESAPMLSQIWECYPLITQENFIQLSLKGVSEPAAAVEALRQHANDKVKLSAAALLTILENSVWHLVAGWPNEQERRKSTLPAILVRIFLTSHNTAPEVAWTAAMVLAATAFALERYPGGEEPSQGTMGQQKRAIQIWRHYQARTLDTDTMDQLFTFGFMGLLPHVELWLHDTQDAALLKSWARTTERSWWRNRDTYSIYGLPNSVKPFLHRQPFFHDCVLSLLDHSKNEPTVEYALAALQGLWSGIDLFYPEFYLSVLVVLRHAQSDELRGSCLGFLQPPSSDFAVIRLGGCAVDQINTENRVIVQALCDSQQQTDTSVLPAFLHYLRLLVASIMLTSYQPLDARQTTLRCLLAQPEFADLATPSPNQTAPTEQQVLDHVSESTDGVSEHDGMLSTMQIVAGFCAADSLGYSEPWTYWGYTFRDIEENFRASHPTPQTAEPSTNKQPIDPAPGTSSSQMDDLDELSF